MQKVPTFLNRILLTGAVAGVLASCTSSKISLTNPAPADHTVTAVAPATQAAETAPAAAQGAPDAEAYASAGSDAAAVAPVTTTLEKAARENAATAAAPKQEGAKKASLTTRLATKMLVKKLEKAQKKFDGKKQKAGKVDDPQIRTGIIIALVGLGVLLVGALTSLWFLYTLGGIGITVGLVIILLAALDVI